MYAHAIKLVGSTATLLEWDDRIPSFDEVHNDLQPYLSLLELDYAVDDFLIAVKKRESDALRGEASNAVQSAPKAAKRRKRIRPPKREKV